MGKSEIILAICLVCLFSLFPVFDAMEIASGNRFQEFLESESIAVIEGDISSPSLILDVELEEFLDMIPMFIEVSEPIAEGLLRMEGSLASPKIVYRDGINFYIFEPSMLVAYRYRARVGFKLPARD